MAVLDPHVRDDFYLCGKSAILILSSVLFPIFQTFHFKNIISYSQLSETVAE